MQDLRLRQ